MEAQPAAPWPGTEPALDGQAAQYFASLDASVEALQRRAQQLINRVNDSRKEDDAVISSFRESLLLKVGALGGTAGEEPPAPGRPPLDAFNCVIPPEVVAGWGRRGEVPRGGSAVPAASRRRLCQLRGR